MKKYIAFERDSFMNRVQFILSLNLLLRLLSCNFLLSSDCLHCLKTSTNLFYSITLSNISYESTSVIVNIKQISKKRKFAIIISTKLLASTKT